MKVKLISHTQNPELIVAIAGKNCYSNENLSDVVKNGIEEKEVKKFVKMLGKLGHLSAYEHASFTFAIEGVSRALLAQITRHRMASFSVKSQRYVSESNFEYITPASITDTEHYSHLMAQISDIYNAMVELGAPKEDARMMLPNACTTQMVVTMNARELLHFFELRCCNRAQWEIRELADEMLKQCKKVAPSLFAKAGAKCMYGNCTEGKMSCGKPRKAEEYEI